MNNFFDNLFESKKKKKNEDTQDRIIMVQGNVVCEKKNNKYLVYEDKDTNVKEYDEEDIAMNDMLKRCGIDPENELVEPEDE